MVNVRVIVRFGLGGTKEWKMKVSVSPHKDRKTNSVCVSNAFLVHLSFVYLPFSQGQ